MYYSLVSHQANFTKKLPQFITQKQTAKLKKILPIGINQAILFYDNFWFFHVLLGNMTVIYKSVLEGEVYDAIAVNNQRVLLMIIQKKNIVELNLKTGKVTEIYKITSESIYNSKRQRDQFSLSRLYLFTDSQGFYLQQNLTDERKVKVIYFHNNKQTQNSKIFQLRQFEAKNYVFLKLDQTSSIVRFRQNPEQNAQFSFQEINLQTNDIIEHKFDWPSFVLYSTVIDVKKFHQEKYLICLNSKNSSHQAIIYNFRQKTVRTLFQTDKIFRQCIFLNEKLNLCMFSFLYGQTLDSQILKLFDLNSGKMIYQTQKIVDKLVVSKNKDFLIEYSAQTKQKPSSTFRLFTLANKTIHYLKIMQNLKLESFFAEQFVNMVAQMLKP